MYWRESLALGPPLHRAKVDKITPTGRITVSGLEFDHRGARRGGSGYRHVWLVEETSEVRAEYEQIYLRGKIQHWVREKMSTASLGQLRAVADSIAQEGQETK